MNREIVALALIVVPTWGNASLFEVLWTIAPLCGLYYAMGSRLHARVFLEAARASGDEGAIIDHTRDVRNEGSRLRLHIFFALVGIIAMLQPPLVRPVTVTPLFLTLTVMLLVVPYDVTRCSFLDRRDRERRDRAFAKRRETLRGKASEVAPQDRP